MTSNLPSIRFGKAEGQLAAITETGRFTSVADLLAAFPALEAPENALSLARALNHFDPKGQKYTVISAPEGFAAAYQAEYNAADEDTPMDPNNPVVSDFALPDLAQISTPENAGGRITFFATINGLGLPYKVSGKSDGSEELTYAPL